MKLVIPVLFFISYVGHVEAADRAVRILVPPGSLYLTGDIVPENQLSIILFTQEPCQLPLADKQGVHRAWFNYGSYQLGCWYPTTDDGYTFIGAVAELSHHITVPWEAYPRGLLRPDGSVKITEPHYNSDTFYLDVINKKVSAAMERALKREKP